MVHRMAPSRPDPFEQFASEHGLKIDTEQVYSAPRDVRATPAALDRHVLVGLAGKRADVPPLRLVFLSSPEDESPPTIRDVLWWLSSDAWAIEHARHDYVTWAAMYEYPDSESATRNLFALHSRQSAGLKTLLGDAGYRDLLTLYEREAEAHK